MTDRIGRWGGEEFMILLPYTPYEEAMELAERLRKSSADYEFNKIGHKTASFGVSNYETNDTLTSLVAKVDKALYYAKRNGKNRVN